MLDDISIKRKILEEQLDLGMVMVVIDARQKGVDVPIYLKEDSQLKLNLSKRFRHAVNIDKKGVNAILNFKGQPYRCVLPWKSIYIVL